MRRIAWGLLVVALVVAGIRVTHIQAAQAAPAAVADPATTNRTLPTRVSLFGDSLAYQARASFSTRMTQRAPGSLNVSTFPTTALCDYRNAINVDLLRRRPQVVVLEFSGNSLTPCMRDERGALLVIGTARWRARYVEDMRAVLAVAAATDTIVVWATAPPVEPPAATDNAPRLLASAARDLASKNHRLRVANTGYALASSDRSYRRTLPCRPDERDLCRSGRIEARAADGLHFDCHGPPGPYGGCLGYSAGARRFGEAMADAAMAAL